MHPYSLLPSRAFQPLVLIAVFVVSTFLLATPLSQAKETVIYNQQNNAANPVGTLVADSSGVLYGTASSDGGPCCGSVFSLTPPAKGQTNWTETILYSFLGGSDGSIPLAGLISDGQGGFYGVTTAGGDGPCDFTNLDLGVPGCGTAFHLTPPAQGQTNWSETVIYSFQDSDGAFPGSRLLIDSATGVLYGMTYLGGAFGVGTIYSLTPPAQGQSNWTESVLHSFTGGADGGNPDSQLMQDANGALYGPTIAGGAYGNGTVIKLTPPVQGQTNWTETVLYTFLGFGFGDGGAPSSKLVADASGNLYGATYAGGYDDAGTVIELSPPTGGETSWSETILYSFNGGKDGIAPYFDNLMDGNGAIYGITELGGTSNLGTAYKLTPPAQGQTSWTKKTLYSFKGGSGDGKDPGGPTAFQAGKKVTLFGVTVNGGANDDGTVYELTNTGFVP